MNKYLIILLSACLFISCSSVNIMKMRPIEQESIVDGGKEIVKQENNGVKIVASYDGRYQKYMVFDVELFNNTDEPLTISPKDFTALPLDINKQQLVSTDGQYAYSYQAIEPEEELGKVREEMNYEETKIKRAKTVNTVLFIGGIIAMIASSSNKTPERAWRTANIGETMVQVAQIKRVVDHEHYYSRMDKLSNEQHTWINENFKATTLAPHTSIRGGVFLEANSQAKFVQLTYTSDKTNLSFLFEQWFEKR
ncbi:MULTISPECIES: hypothetical protein [unclassified Arcicella]|uniref:hypothetical protein n=1 Tax=unclassified Arcicella TaxID=2644986 RepID=UPI0028571BF8|nr:MULTISPECIES: hypothetical protein [unclassified Arcicella]MDR6562605.1 G3E family GTPase [Arcicella sp. BE51]MDR6812692.1 G3E family GTPase [Arcicella sp. BE140]MDR6824004.1 G3E family GTPase [Arcicella sp. BE139]